MGKNRCHFDERYREETELKDGSRVLIRVIRPEDRAVLLRGFDRLSAESRYLRFMGRKAALSEAEVAEAAATVAEAEDGVVRVLVELPSFATLMADTDRGDLLGRLLAQAAGGGLTVRLGSLLLKRR